MFGPPGTGKSRIASCLPGILPKMSVKEVLECSMIVSIAGKFLDGKLNKSRAFRTPHHSCSLADTVGGGVGKKVKPREITLAQRHVIFG